MVSPGRLLPGGLAVLYLTGGEECSDRQAWRACQGPAESAVQTWHAVADWTVRSSQIGGRGQSHSQHPADLKAIPRPATATDCGESVLLGEPDWLAGTR